MFGSYKNCRSGGATCFANENNNNNMVAGSHEYVNSGCSSRFFDLLSTNTKKVQRFNYTSSIRTHVCMYICITHLLHTYCYFLIYCSRSGCAHVCVWLWVCMVVCTCVFVVICACGCAYVCVCACVRAARVCVCICVCACTCTCVCPPVWT